MSDEFTCAKCGGTFEKGRSDEEAWAEYEGPPSADVVLVCEDCFHEFKRWREKVQRDWDEQNP